MQEPLFVIPVSYTTKPETDNQVSAFELGQSLIGFSRLSSAITHTVLTGRVPTRRTKLLVKFYVGPPQKGSIVYQVTAILGAIQLPIWWEYIKPLASPLYEHLLSAVLSFRLGRRDQEEKMLEIIQDQIARQDEMARFVLNLQSTDARHAKEIMRDIVRDLSNTNTKSMSDLAQPIGRSSGPVWIGNKHDSAAVMIDEPAASVLRSKEDVTIGDTETLQVIFRGVDITTGICRVELGDRPTFELKGTITDPSLRHLNSVYTQSLNGGLLTEITAKPILKDGVVKSLYISDGKIVP